MENYFFTALQRRLDLFEYKRENTNDNKKAINTVLYDFSQRRPEQSFVHRFQLDPNQSESDKITRMLYHERKRRNSHSECSEKLCFQNRIQLG